METPEGLRPIRESGRKLTKGHWVYSLIDFMAAVSNCISAVSNMCIPPRRIDSLVTLNDHDTLGSDSEPLYD